MNKKAVAVRDGIVAVNLVVVFGYIFFNANRPWGVITIGVCVLAIGVIGYSAYRAIAAYRSADDRAKDSGDDF